MKEFISCDWGTSSLRLRLVGMDGQKVLAEVMSAQGIAGTFESWKQSGKGAENRVSFYQSVLKGQITALEEKTGSPLQGIPLVVSGMASSNIGMMELPYKELPFRADGSDLKTGILEATDDFNHPVIVVSGGKTDRDVMRGEETQLAGCTPLAGRAPLAGCAPGKGDAGQLFLFPGTHSKHIFVKDQNALRFKTYMTGEFFSLLSRNSILSGSVREGERNMPASFEEGVMEATRTNLLNSAFFVRTNSLFGKYTPEENYYYMSGLLIGTELKELIDLPFPLTVVGDETQKIYYLTALRKLGIPGVQFQDAAQAVVKGHCKIYQQYVSNIKPS
jgi:2-dehydro-3-deoxygalactonokinase